MNFVKQLVNLNNKNNLTGMVQGEKPITKINFGRRCQSFSTDISEEVKTDRTRSGQISLYNLNTPF